MSVTVSLTEPMIRELASSQSYQRGREYQRGGQVLRLTLRGDHLDAEVQGSDYEPYRVRVTFDQNGIADTSCTCPYDWGGVCKHVVAALLAYLHDQPAVEERPETAELLAVLDRDQLQALLLAVLERHPELVDWVEAKAQTLQARPVAGTSAGAAVTIPNLPPPDPAALRQRVRAVFRLSGRRGGWRDDYWNIARDAAAELQEFLDEADPWIEAGEGRTAMSILEAITDEAVSGWSNVSDYDEEGEGGAVFDALGERWTEAILSADLTPAERKSWEERLEDWHGEIGDYVDTGFSTAAAAARQGWDDPTLQRVLQGGSAEEYSEDEESSWNDEDLNEARLNILERQGRIEEYLRLARAAGESVRYGTMLVKLGRTQEAFDFGMQHLTNPNEALALAQALQAGGETERALRIAEHGLDLGATQGGPIYYGYSNKSELARWLRDEARNAGQTERALRGGRAVLESQPSLKDYLTLQSIAGEGWPALREEVLAALRTRPSHYREPEIQIYLHEGLIDDAIAALGSHAHYSLVEQVAEAAKKTHPEWVIQVSKKQAESIMDAGQASAYEHAAEWLAKARAAYLALGRKEEWDTYLAGVMATHQRKYKLMPMLRKLV